MKPRPVAQAGGLRQRLRRRDIGHDRAAALFAGRDHDPAPVRQALVGALRIQLHLAAFAGDRQDAGDAELGRLLQDPVHLLAAGDALQQGDAQRRFVVDMSRRCDLRACFALADGGDARVVVVAIAVEQHAGIADLQAQHAQQVRGDVLGQHDFGAGLQWQVDMAAGQAHAVASMMASRVTRASSSSCSSSMQYGGIQYSVSPSGRSTTSRSSAAR